IPCSTGPATADTRAAMPGSTTRRGSASRSVSTEPAVGSVISRVKVGLTCIGLEPGPDQAVRLCCPGEPGVLPAEARSGNKKERVPKGPLSIRDRMRTISCRRYNGFRAIRQGPEGLEARFCAPFGDDFQT